MNKSELLILLKTSPFFAILDNKALHCLYPKLESINLTANQILMQAGDIGDCLYIIEHGKLDILLKNEHGTEVVVASRHRGESVGEIALLTSEKRNATIKSNGTATLLRLAKSSFDSLNLEHPIAFQQITQAIIYRLQQSQLQQLLKTSGIFKHLNNAILRDLERELKIIMLKSGDYLVCEGDVSNSLHFIINGRLQILSNTKSGKLKIWAEIGRGQSVGEMGILTGEKRSASVVALRDSLIAKLTKESFYRLLEKYPQAITQQFSGSIIQRLWKQLQGDNHNSNTLATFSVVPANASIDIADFCHNLADSLTQFGTVLFLSSKRINNMLNKADAAQTTYTDAYNINLIRWLGEQETKYKYIIYQTDKTVTAWSERCLRQADRVLIVATAQATAATGELSNNLQQYCHKVDKTLVLLHGENNRSPRNTKQWLEQTKPQLHLHIRQQEQDFKRLARILTGNSSSLVLSGGGARGFAHIGAIFALEELGLEIDQIAGTSMGAILAAQYAMGWNAQAMLEKSRVAIKKHYKMEYTLPLVSLLTGKAWGNFLRAFFVGIQIEDLWLNYFCCASNLTARKLKIYEQGSLWKAVRASSSIPGLVPPVYDNGDIIVDGAVLNNMPIDVMRTRNNGGKVYAVDVGSGISDYYQHEFNPVQSGWKLLLARNKNSPYIPSMMSVLMQSATMGSQMTSQAAHKMADLYIKPKVVAYSVLDFKSIDSIVVAGYKSAQQQIKQWQAHNNIQN